MSVPGFHHHGVIRAGAPDQQRMFHFLIANVGRGRKSGKVEVSAHVRRILDDHGMTINHPLEAIKAAWRIEQATLVGAAFRPAAKAVQVNGHPRDAVHEHTARTTVRKVAGLGKPARVAAAVHLTGARGQVAAQAWHRENGPTAVLRVEAFQNRMRQLFGRGGTGL